MRRTTPEWLEMITTATIEYLQMQVEAGVDAIQIFDSWAGKLDPLDFSTLALPYLKKIVDALRPTGIPITLFCRGSTRYIKELVSLEPTALSFDWEKEMHELRKEVPAHIAIQGNLDPAILKGPLDVLQEKAKSLLCSMQGERGFIFNLGHGVVPETPVENVRWLIEYIKVTEKG
jgi:uroporphyrinogen decarboxylase